MKSAIVLIFSTLLASPDYNTRSNSEAMLSELNNLIDLRTELCYNWLGSSDPQVEVTLYKTIESYYWLELPEFVEIQFGKFPFLREIGGYSYNSSDTEIEEVRRIEVSSHYEIIDKMIQAGFAAGLTRQGVREMLGI